MSSVQVEAIIGMSTFSWSVRHHDVGLAADLQVYRNLFPNKTKLDLEQLQSLFWWEHVQRHTRLRKLRDQKRPFAIFGWDILDMCAQAGSQDLRNGELPGGTHIERAVPGTFVDLQGQDVYIGALHQLLKLRGTSFADYEVVGSRIQSGLAESLARKFVDCGLGSMEAGLQCVLPVLTILHRTSLGRACIARCIARYQENKDEEEEEEKKKIECSLNHARDVAHEVANRYDSDPNFDAWNAASEFDYAYACSVLEKIDVANPKVSMEAYERLPSKKSFYTLSTTLFKMVELVQAEDFEEAAMYAEMVAEESLNYSRLGFGSVDRAPGGSYSEEGLLQAVRLIPATFGHCSSKNSWILPEAMARICLILTVTHISSLDREVTDLSRFSLLWTYKAAFLAEKRATVSFLSRGIHWLADYLSINAYTGSRHYGRCPEACGRPSQPTTWHTRSYG